MSAMKFRARSRSMLSALLTGLSLAAIHSANAAPPAVPTQNNDNARTGANVSETILSPTTVTATSFKKLFTRSLDANVNGQVLYVPNVTIGGASHNVIYAYTSNNSNNSPSSLYAFDADDPNASIPLWRHQFTNSARWTTATPAIDTATNTIYVLTKDTDDNGANNLRALDITTGNEKPGSPIAIAASVAGTGDGSSNGVVTFANSHANERPGLLFVNGNVYVAFAHNSDSFPYQGWVLAYSYDQTKFTQTAVFCTTPNGGDGGVWQAGKGLTADSSGNIYCSVGNGTFDVNSGGIDYGMCYLKLSPSLKVLDWTASYDEKSLSDQDLDVGSTGLAAIPGTNRLFAGATKYGSVYLLDSTNLGGFTSGGPDKVVQRINSVSPNDSVGQNPIAWDASTVKYAYLWPGSRNIEQFQYSTTTNQFNPAGVWKQTSNLTGGGGGSLTVTSNGTTDGILWAVGSNSIFHAFDATDLSKPELWNSSLNAGDALPSVGHFQFPTVVNGKAYISTGSSSIAVYGLAVVQSNTLTPTADAYVRAGRYADTNYGSVNGLIVKKVSNDSNSIYNRAAYLKFDLSSVTAAPSSATLTLTVNSISNPATSSETVQFYSVADTTWTESGITWNNAPGLNRTNFSSTGTLLTSKSVALKPSTVTIDLTALVKANLGKVVTIQLIDASTENKYLVFNSKEATTGKPQLTIVP